MAREAAECACYANPPTIKTLGLHSLGAAVAEQLSSDAVRPLNAKASVSSPKGRNNDGDDKEEDEDYENEDEDEDEPDGSYRHEQPATFGAACESRALAVAARFVLQVLVFRSPPAPTAASSLSSATSLFSSSSVLTAPSMAAARAAMEIGAWFTWLAARVARLVPVRCPMVNYMSAGYEWRSRFFPFSTSTRFFLKSFRFFDDARFFLV